MKPKFQFNLLAIFGLTALVAWFFALPVQLRTFLLVFFSTFISLVLIARWIRNGWRVVFGRRAD